LTAAVERVSESASQRVGGAEISRTVDRGHGGAGAFAVESYCICSRNLLQFDERGLCGGFFAPTGLETKGPGFAESFRSELTKIKSIS
jgi:hypothetical protein